MKKILFLLVLVFTVLVSNAQLNVQTVSDYAHYKTVYTVTYFGSSMGEIRYISNPEQSGYYLLGVTANQFEKTMASIYLGQTKESAVKSIKDLKKLYDTSETGEYVVDGFKCKTHIVISYQMGAKSIQIKSDGVAGLSGIPSWFCTKDKHYNGAIDAINSFIEE